MGFIFRVFLDGIWFPIFLTILGKRFTRKRTASPIRIRIVATMAIRIKSNLIVTAGIGLYYRGGTLEKGEKGFWSTFILVEFFELLDRNSCLF